jgi:hypothetical protein
LDKAQSEGRVLKEVVVVPFANPIGLSLSTGINFNRDWIDLSSSAIFDKLINNLESNNADKGQNSIFSVFSFFHFHFFFFFFLIVLSLTDEKHNVRVVRLAMESEINSIASKQKKVKDYFSITKKKTKSDKIFVGLGGRSDEEASLQGRLHF